MDLQYKPDFPRTLERFEAWWHCQIVDRPPVSIHVRPDRPPAVPAKHHASLRDRWLDAEYQVDCAAARLAAGVCVGDSLPVYMPNIGPEVCAAVFGSEIEFSEGTSWSVPCVESCREILAIPPDLDNVYWSTLRRMTDLSLQRGAGKWLTGITDLHTNGDLLASLRDPQALCVELVEDPDAVRAACDYVTTHYALMYDDLYAPLAAAGQPSLTWIPAPHAGRMYATSCDFICMISPAMFEATILPAIVWEMRYLDRNIFHLDGPGALVHLDRLLSLEEMDGVQWVYGAGNEPAARWIDVYRRCQAAGKCLLIYTVDLDDARAVAEAIRPEGAWFHIGGSHRRADAEAFVAWVSRWAAGKR